jgi:hypothetical protein
MFVVTAMKTLTSPAAENVKMNLCHRLVFWLAFNICGEPSVSLYRTVEVFCTLKLSGITLQLRCRTTKLYGIKGQETVISAGHTVPTVTLRYKLLRCKQEGSDGGTQNRM